MEILQKHPSFVIRTLFFSELYIVFVLRIVVDEHFFQIKLLFFSVAMTNRFSVFPH